MTNSSRLIRKYVEQIDGGGANGLRLELLRYCYSNKLEYAFSDRYQEDCVKKYTSASDLVIYDSETESLSIIACPYAVFIYKNLVRDAAYSCNREGARLGGVGSGLVAPGQGSDGVRPTITNGASGSDLHKRQMK